ncbi:MAG: hypothetical protein IJJ67_00465 [Oscillospiraceae bacterium]|nr:hypothetical protein [Oscillospiraceae bacterium]
MKKILLISLLTALILALCACGSAKPVYISEGETKFTSVLGTTFDYDCMTSPYEPEEKYDGLLWLDTSGDPYHLRRYSESVSSWSEETVYTKITFSSKGVLPGLFAAGDDIEMVNEETGDRVSAKILVVGGSSWYEDFIVIDLTLYENRSTDAEISIYRK